MVQPAHVEKALQFTIEKLRDQLARRSMAFGALFIGMKSDANQPSGYMLVFADNAPAHIRIQMLDDLIHTAQKTLEHYRKAS